MAGASVGTRKVLRLGIIVGVNLYLIAYNNWQLYTIFHRIGLANGFARPSVAEAMVRCNNSIEVNPDGDISLSGFIIYWYAAFESALFERGSLCDRPYTVFSKAFFAADCFPQ